MKRFIAVLTFMALLAPVLSHAEGDEGPLLFSADVGNTESLQRGARDFMNYCSGCHTLKYLRYATMGSDLGIPDNLLTKDLIFVHQAKTAAEMKSGKPPLKVRASSKIVNAMSADDAKAWFSKAPPDLTLEAEVHSPRWIYNYLQSFYIDSSRPSGVNNPLLPGVAMPDVLWSLQGWQKQVTEKGGETHLESLSKGSMTPQQFQGFVRDVTNFLTYAASPDKLERSSLGPKVLLFLLILLVLAYLLKKEFWRDIH